VIHCDSFCEAISLSSIINPQSNGFLPAVLPFLLILRPHYNLISIPFYIPISKRSSKYSTLIPLDWCSNVYHPLIFFFFFSLLIEVDPRTGEHCHVTIMGMRIEYLKLANNICIHFFVHALYTLIIDVGSMHVR
jgi:hypothetical protein